MKVLHVAETIKGGVATVIRTLIAHQVEIDSSVIHCLIPAEHSQELGSLAGLSRHTFRRTGRNLASLVRMAFRFGGIVLHERPDVVHMHSTFAGAICRLVLFVLRPVHRTRTVYCSHGWSFMMDVSTLVGRFYKAVERILLEVTDVVVCVSQFERKAAIDAGLDANKLRLIYNGVPQRVGAVRPDNGSDGKVIRLLFIGRLDHQKGFDLLVKAMSLLPPDRYHLTVIGDSVTEHTRFPDRGNIAYVGWLTPEEMPAHIMASDALVMPSRWEAFGLVAVEAQRLGLPVLAANVCSVPEIVEDGRTGLLFPPNCPEAISSTIERCTLPELRALGRAALESNDRFSVEEMGRLTRLAYES